jgi:hypothetical protein
MPVGCRLGHLLAAGIFSVLFAAPTRAETYTAAGHSIRFIPPSGYCLVNPEGAVGAIVFEQVRKIWGGELEPVGIYIDCGELSTLLTDHRSPPLHLGALAVAKQGGEIDVRSQGTRRDELDRVADRSGHLDLAAINEQLKIHGQERGFAFSELAEVRMADRDASAVYIASITKPDDQNNSFVRVEGVTLVNQLALSNIMAAPVGDPDVLNGLLRAQRRYLASFIDLNETPEQQRLQNQATSGLFDGSPQAFLGYATMAIGAACVLVALWLVFRMLR